MKRTLTAVSLAFVSVFAVVLGNTVPSFGAQIEGQITNRTTRQPLAHQKVELLSPRGGMASVAEATTDAQGDFVLAGAGIDPSGFYIVQATYEGVDYNSPVKFDPDGHALINLEVYESTTKKPALRIRSARVIVRAEGSQAHIQELFALENPIERAYRNPQGTFFFHLSRQVSTPTVAAIGLMNMPLPQTPENGKAPGDFHISYALKPGLNIMMVAYDEDYSGEKLVLDDSVPYPISRAELFVLPPDLTVTSSLFSPAGKDAESGSQKLVAQGLSANTQLAAEVTGQATAATEATDEANPRESESKVEVVRDSVSAVGVPLLLCFLLILLWALGIRAAKEWPRWKAKQKGSPLQKQFQAKMETLINSIADIDELFASGKIAEKQYWKERLELKAKAVAILKKGSTPKDRPYAARDSHS